MTRRASINTAVIAVASSEEELRSSYLYARGLLEASLDPLVTISPEGKLTDVNAATEVATGVSRAELIGTDFASYFTEPEKAKAGWQQAFKEGSVTDYALALRHRSGAIKDVVYNARVYRDEKGAIAGVFAAARDVTARKRAEESRTRIMRALRMLNACNNVMIHAMGEAQLVEDTCRMIVQHGGYPFTWVGYAEDDPAKTVRPVAYAGTDGNYIDQAKISWSADDERGRGPTGKAIRTGERIVARDTATEPDYDPWRKNAAAHGFRSTATMPLKTNGKAFGALMVYAADEDAFDADELELLSQLANDLSFAISALRMRSAHEAAEHALKQSENRLRLQIRRMPIGHVTWDTSFKVLSWNPAAEKIFGFGAEEVQGKHPYEFLVPQTQQAAINEVWIRLMTGDMSSRSINENITKDGRTILCEWTNTPLREPDGQVYGVMSMVEDITERKRAEQELERYHSHLEEMVKSRTESLSVANAQLNVANEELEAFSYSVSHDLRTPLRAIDGFSRILLEDYAGKLDTEGKRLLGVVCDNTAKMSRLIDDILSFSRISRAEFVRTEVDMKALAAASLESLKPQTAGRKIAFDIRELPPAGGDAAMLQRVWTNLLDNAIKFTVPKPDAKVEIGAKQAENERVYYVKDNGVGFDMQYVKKLFGVFQRLHGSEFPGTGVGLAIIKRIVARHGGRVWAEGKEGEGATFYFALPKGERP